MPETRVRRPEPELAYHRLLRAQHNYRWWRPLVAVVLIGVFIFIGTLLVVILGMIIGVATGQVRLDDAATMQADLEALVALDAARPLGLAIGLISVAIWLPAVPLALLCAGIRPVGVVNSVAFRIRWGWLARCLVPAVVVMAVTLAIMLLLPLLTGEEVVPTAIPVSTMIVSIVIIVLVTPFQAAAEEYVFRGVLAQALGAWVRFAPLAIVLPTLLFVAGHAYDIWGLLDVGVFGVVAAILVWRTGGLEAGIAMHAVNNVALFLLLASGVQGTAVTSDGGSPLALAITVVTMGGFALWVDRSAKRHGIHRTAPAPAPVAPPAAAPAGPGMPPPPPPLAQV